MDSEQPTFCHCGCGEPTPISDMTSKAKGWVAGKPRKWVPGHHKRKLNLADPTTLYRVQDGPLDTPCWLWTGKLDPKGYAARVRVDGRDHEAHRMFYERKHGPVDPSMELDHLCRMRACVNPEHLEPVTHAENLQRSPLVSKLDAEKVRQIRRRADAGESSHALANEYGVSYCTIRLAVQGRTWRDVM